MVPTGTLPRPQPSLDRWHPELAALAPAGNRADVAYAVRQHLSADHGAAGLRRASKLGPATLALGALGQTCSQELWWRLALCACQPHTRLQSLEGVRQHRGQRLAVSAAVGAAVC